MYKKIKNGSFMNWIWFMLCILPLCFILFSLNNEENKTQIYQNELDYINEDSNLSLYDWDNIYGDMTYDYLNNNLLIQQGSSDNEFTFEFYLTIQENVQKNYWYYFLFNLPYKADICIIDLYEYEENDYQHFLNYYYDGEYIDYIILPFQYNFIFPNANENYFSLKITITLSINDFVNNHDLEFGIFANENYIEKEYFKDFPNEIIIQPLNYWFNNFKSNGFISQSFLNLSQYFGVTNIYYSLACYYIEYLLIIVLLHLGFDLLYIVPNICHKFMEKIGGERD